MEGRQVLAMTHPSPNQNADRPSANYYGNSNPDLLNIIPVTAKKIIEFGCGSGALCADFKTRSPSAVYIGVEMHQESADKAGRVLDHVVCGNAEDPDLINHLLATHGTADVLIYGDTIEHFVDPWRTLETHMRLLKPDGVICACIPNSQHWSLSVRLLAGHMEYSEHGGLNDRTHLHLFTASSIRRFFERLGLEIVKTRPRKFGSPPAMLNEVSNAISSATKTDPKILYEGLTTFQYVVQATRPNPETPLFIDCRTVRAVGGFNHIRATAPCRFMASVPNVSVRLHEKVASIQHEIGHANIFIWQRPILAPKSDMESIRKLRKHKKLIISDFDDDPDLWPAIAEHQNLTFVGSHAVQVSTESLRRKILPLNPNVFVVPNRLPVVRPYEVVKNATVARTMFLGGFNRGPDFQPIAEIINQFIQSSATPWHFYIVGDRRILDYIGPERHDFYDILPYDQYRTLLEKADFALLPLKDTPSNQLKSNLKFLEAAASGAIVIAGTTVYEQTVEHGRTGFLYGTPGELYDLLLSLDGHNELDGIRKAAHEYVKLNSMLAPSITTTLSIYRELYERYDALDTELEQRLAKIN